MSKDDQSDTAIKPSNVKVGPLLAKLPRLKITTQAAPNKKAAAAAGIAYGVTSAKKLTEAFAVKSIVRKD